MSRKRKAAQHVPRQAQPVAYLTPAGRGWAMVLIGLFSFLLYAGTLAGGYVADDEHVIVQNRFVQQGLAGLPDIFSTSYRQGCPGMESDGLYRPLSLAMFALEWQLFPGNPVAGHVVNVLLYSLTCMLLFALLLQWLGREGRGFLLALGAALLFAALPVHAEVVANIKSRDEILALLFMLCSLWCLQRGLRKQSWQLHLAGLACAFLALLSKESAIALIAICPLALYVFTEEKPGCIARTGLCLCSVAALYFTARFMVMGGYTLSIPTLTPLDNSLLAAPDLSSRLATAMLVLGKYLMLLVLPARLSWDYSTPAVLIVSWTSPAALISLAAYSGLAAAGLWWLKKKQPAGFAVWFYLACLAPAANIFILIGATMAERLLYSPSVGFCMLAVCVLARLCAAQPEAAQEKTFLQTAAANRVLCGVIIALLALCSGRTIARAADWQTSLGLYSHDRQSLPTARTQYNYGRELLLQYRDGLRSGAADAARLEDAVLALTEATRLYPAYADAYMNLGTAAAFKSDATRAIEYSRLALRYSPNRPDIYNNLASFYGMTGDIETAVDYCKKALALSPDDPEIYNNLGTLYVSAGAIVTAIGHFKKALSLAQHRNAAYNLAACYRHTGQTAQAEAALRKLLARWPDDGPARALLDDLAAKGQ